MAESRRHFSEIMNTVREVETEEDDEEKARIYKEPMRRNLLDVFDKTIPVEISDERMSVFLRVRPFAAHEVGSEENQGCVEVKNNYMVTAIAPKDSHTYKAQLYGLNKARHTFTFSRVFPESTTQKEFFDSTMLKLVQDFIEGQNCLVFTYGVTNSGKTYTIQGNPHEAGILPRGLDVLFNSISGKQWPGMDLKPSMFCDVVKLSPEEEEREQKVKERTLRLNSSDDHDVMTLLGDDASDQSAINTTAQSDSSCDRKGSMDSPEDLLAALENRVREETAVDVGMQGQIRFSVWVSFAEIYNEQIFDLLEPMPKKKDARRPVLKLSEDRRGSPYIKGLKEVNVTSADEAYKLLTIGQRNLKTACTRLNHCSSRSHCIFNIKIIRVPDKGNPQMARVSMLSLCDLAGSERHSKTHTTGERLKEAGNINTSLLTLGRCIELLRYNQQHKDKENKIIPFRESRLTRLFQNFFCGRGKAAMIVNVSQCASMFDETLTVFKFSAIAKQVVIPPRPVEKAPEPKPKRQRTTKSTTTRASSICWDTSTTPSRQSCVTTESVVEEEGDIDEESDEDSDYIEQLEERVEELENRVRELKRERLAREVEIRKEVCQEMQEQFVKIEDMYSTMLRETRQEEAERFEKKLKLVMEYSKPHLNKRPRLDETAASSSAKKFMVDDDDEWVSSVLLHQEKVKVQEYEASLAELRGRNTELEFQVADLTRKAKELADRAVKAEEAQNKLQQSGEDLGHSLLLETLGRQLQEAKDRLKQQEKEIADLNEMLTDAGITFHQKEKEISKLKQVIAEDEEKSQQQMQTIRELQSLLEESKAAVEDSEKRLEAKNHSISDMKGTLDPLHPASTTIFNRGRKVDAHPTPVVMVTPLRNAQPSQSVCGKSDDEESVPQELEVQKETEVCPSPLLIPGTPSPVRTPCQPRPLPHFKESPFVGNSSKHIIPSTPEMIATKTEKNRVLRVVVTPIQKLIFKQTKTSLMRLRLTPNKSASSTPKQSKTSLMRLRLTPNKSASSTPKQSPAAPITRNTRRGKRTISEVDPTPTPDHTTKVGRAQQVQNKGRANKLKKRSSLASRIKYNLRARC